MSKKNKLVGQIGYVSNKDLKISDKSEMHGHYVYIRSYEKGKCEVNTFTSLEDKNELFVSKKIKRVKDGLTYPVPKNDSNLPLFSGLNKDVIKDVDILKIKDIGKKKIKKRHRFFIDKFMK